MDNEIERLELVAADYQKADLHLEKIPEQPGRAKTPDLRTSNGGHGWLVEVKSPQQPARVTEGVFFFQQSNPSGSSGQQAEKGAKQIRRLLSEAVDQFREHDPIHEKIWCCAIVIDSVFYDIYDIYIAIQGFHRIKNIKITTETFKSNIQTMKKIAHIDLISIHNNDKMVVILNNNGNRYVQIKRYFDESLRPD